jgi:long-chain acyl-CoA synthetase
MAFGDRLRLAREKDVTLGTLLERLATIRGDRRLAEEPEGVRLTYTAAAELVARAAGTLHGSVGRGDRVVVRTPNGYELFLACLAVARAGGVAVPVNPRMAAEEIAHVVADAGAALEIDDFATLTDGDPAPPVGVDPSDVALIFYSSGTTGDPKGAQLTHRALVRNVSGGALAPQRIFEHGCVSGLPVAHVAGFTMLIMLAALGIPVYLLTKFRPTDALDAIERQRAIMFIGVPAMYRMMLEAGAERRDLSSVRLWSSGADALPDDIVERFQRLGAAITLPGVGRGIGRATFIDGYGMVELGGGVAVRIFPPVPLPIGGLLRPMAGHRFRIIDDNGDDTPPGEAGELLIRGPGVMRGYHGRDDATADTITSDGWLRTGDLARARRFGFFELAGRKKDVIKHGGYSVFAVEVERALEQHPAVVEAAVVGLPDDRKGEVPAAVVTLAEHTTIGGDDLIAYAKKHLSDYKVPQRVIVVDRLPRTGTEKVAKKQLLPLFDTDPPPPG